MRSLIIWLGMMLLSAFLGAAVVGYYDWWGFLLVPFIGLYVGSGGQFLENRYA